MIIEKGSSEPRNEETMTANSKPNSEKSSGSGISRRNGSAKDGRSESAENGESTGKKVDSQEVDLEFQEALKKVASDSGEGAEKVTGSRPEPLLRTGKKKVAGRGDGEMMKIPVIPPRDPENPGSDGDGPNWTEWIIDSNPMYLISVLMMMYGLMLVSREALENNIGVGTVTLFFGIQNVYEIVLVAMGIFLLKTQTNLRHGKMLLFFIMAFMADLTGYMVRISAMDATWGKTVALSYLVLGAFKIIAVVQYLKITPRWERLVYPISAFAIIYFAPQYLYHVMDSVGKGSAVAGQPASFFSGHTEVYMIWLFAAFIQIPTIVGTWKNNDLEEDVYNPCFGNERHFYWGILLFPFIVLPYQLFKNVLADAASANSALANMNFVLIPYALFGIFFTQAFFRKYIEREISLNLYDFCMLMLAFLFSLGTDQSTEVVAPLAFVNKLLVVCGHAAVAVSRKNALSAGFLASVALYYCFGMIKYGAGRAYDYASQLSRVAWAGILMVGSFAFLGLGFFLSLKSRPRRVLTPGTENA